MIATAHMITIMAEFAEGRETFSDGNVSVFFQATLPKRLPTLSFIQFVFRSSQLSGSSAAC